MSPLSATYEDKVHTFDTLGMKVSVAIKKVMLKMPKRLQIYAIILKALSKLKIYKIKIDKLPFTGTKKIMFYDMEINIPINYKKYLVELYDAEWMIPKKDWHWWDNKKGWQST